MSLSITPPASLAAGGPALSAAELAEPFRFWFENTRDLLCIVGNNGFFLHLNPRWEQLLGYTCAELQAQPILSYIHLEDQSAVQTALAQWSAGQTVLEPLECRLRCHEGGYRWLRWIGTPDQSHARTYALAYDITAQRETKKALPASEARFGELLQNLPGAVFRFKVRDGVLQADFISERVADLAGVSADEVMRDFRTLTARIHPDDRDVYLASADAARSREVPWEHEGRFLLPDGSIRFWRAIYSPPRSAEAELIIDGVLLDITTAKQPESQAQKQAQVLEMILSNAGDGVIAVDERGSVMIFNAAAIRMFGAGAVTDDSSQWARVYGNFLLDTVTPFPTEELPMTRAMRGEDTDNVEMFVRHAQCPDGRWVSVTGRPLRDGHGAIRGGVVVCRDITERKRAEEAQQKTLAQQEVIRAQQKALAELSTPLIPISDSVMVMPLIGAVDSHRIKQVMYTLLNGVVQNRARVVILDITGVAEVDTQVANALIQAATSVKLLGAQVMLTGIRPEVAQTLVSLGVDLSKITTSSTLQSGIALAIGERRAELR